MSKKIKVVLLEDQMLTNEALKMTIEGSLKQNGEYEVRLFTDAPELSDAIAAEPRWFDDVDVLVIDLDDPSPGAFVEPAIDVIESVFTNTGKRPILIGNSARGKDDILSIFNKLFEERGLGFVLDDLDFVIDPNKGVKACKNLFDEKVLPALGIKKEEKQGIYK